MRLNGASLHLRNLTVGALDAMSVTVAPGEVLCLTGASGSGKTRLLRAIADLEPHEGEVALGDHDQRALPGHQWRRRVMMVPAESQWWSDRVGDHFPAGCPQAELETLGFSLEVMDWGVSRLSSGERQRLALLRSLALEPDALLLDEPTANLDPDLVARVEAWLLQHIRSRGMPVIWVAHDRDQVRRVADSHWRILGTRLEPV